MGEAAKGVDLERSRLVRLSTGKTVEVKKWSYTRSNQAGKIVREVVDLIPKGDDGKVKGSGNLLMDMFTDGIGAERMLDLVRLSVPKDCIDLIDPDMDADDAHALIEATVALNGGAAKKASGLPSQFLQILAANAQ